MKYNVPLHVRSSFSDASGTLVTSEDAGLESVVVAGVTSDTNTAKITIRAVPDQPGIAAKIFEALAEKKISVDMIIQNVSAHRLQHLDDPVECDVIVSGAKAPREAVMALCPLIPGLRAVNGGPLGNARIVEDITALLIGLNIRYKLPEGLGIRLTGLPDGD